MQNYHPQQQQTLFPPPGHSNANGPNAITSPFSMAPSAVNTFDRGTPDTLLSSQLGFARGVSAQGYQGHGDMAHPREKQEDTRIRNVWKHNLRQEMATLRALVEEYPYIAMVGTQLNLGAQTNQQ
jgi:CCR4-NOT transcription complex subunit 7/8